MSTSLAHRSLKSSPSRTELKVRKASPASPTIKVGDVLSLADDLRRFQVSAVRRLATQIELTVRALDGAGPLAQTPKVAPATSVPLVIDTTENMVKNGLLVKPDRFQELMGWATRQAVWKALASNRVFAMSLGPDRFFPVFFASHDYERKHLEEVTKALGDLPGGAKMQFFLSRKGSLNGKTVLEALAAGQVEKVLGLAAANAEA